MQEKAILDIDISKKKFDVCLMIGNRIRHKVFDNQDDGYQKLVAWCKHQGANLMHVCMEATSHYMEAVATYLDDLGHHVSVVNPAQIKAFTRSELLRGKNDKSDVAAIARFCLSHNPRKWQIQPVEARSLRDMYRCLQYLKKQKLQLMNKLENDKMNNIAKEAILSIIEANNQELKKLEQAMHDHISNHDNLKAKINLISSIKGLGVMTSIALLAEMPLVENFSDARKYAAFAGLTPASNQSGSSLNKKSRICKIGSTLIRKALYMPAIVVKNYNEYFKDFCTRLSLKGKAPKIIIIALMRKIMHVIFGMLKNNQKFNPDLV